MACRDDMADQLVLEAGPDGEWAIHNLLLDGPGSAAVLQAKMPLAQYLGRVSPQYVAQEPRLFGLLPQGMTLRGMYERHGLTVILIEVPWGKRTLRWLCDDSPQPYGPGATYRDVAVALPYQYFFVAGTVAGGLSGRSSVYFMNCPLRSLNEPLGDCHYYNCSVDVWGLHCWICTQYVDLQLKSRRGVTSFEVTGRFIEWFFSSSFNASSEYHEGASFWGRNRHQLGDRRVASLATWEQATARDPEFILTVPWQPSRTALQVFKELTPARGSQPQQLSDLVSLVR